MQARMNFWLDIIITFFLLATKNVIFNLQAYVCQLFAHYIQRGLGMTLSNQDIVSVRTPN